MRRLIDLDGLILVGDEAVLLGLAHKDRVTTCMHRGAGLPVPAIEPVDGKRRVWLRQDMGDWRVQERNELRVD